MAELKVMIEKMTDIPPINRYLSAIAVCNSLALLASQGTLTVYLQRISLLKRIQKTWTKGPEVTLSLTADTDSDEELQPVGPKETWNIRNDLESVRIELDEASILPDGYLLEPVKQDVKDKILEDVKQVKEEEKQLTKQALRSSGSRPQRLKKTSKGQQRRKTKTGKSSAKAHTPHGQTDQFASETLSIGSTGEGTPDGDQAGSTEVDFICTDCGLHLKTFVQLKNHRRQEHEYKVDIKPVKKYLSTSCGNNFDFRSSLVQDKKLHENTSLVCSICSKSFTYKQHLKRHVAKHMVGDSQSTQCAKDPKQYICSSCGKCFRSVRSFSEHKKLHMGVKQHICGVCGEGFMQANVLVTHMRFLHTGERPHVCNVCGKQYIRSTLLKYHMRSHSGEKPYICMTCGKAFALQVYLKRHFMMHSGENPYACSECSVKFNTRSKLKRHMMTHSNTRPFGCSLCTRTFSQMVNLRTHMRTHTGEKPYMCQSCGTAFAHHGSLKKHAPSHNEEDV